MHRALLILLLIGWAGGSPEHTPRDRVEAGDPALVRVEALMFYDNTPFTGIVVESFTDGSERSETPYQLGLKQGESRGWYADGTPRFSRSYAEGNRTGIHRGWWEDGTLKFEYRFEQDLHEGAAREWFHDGTPYREFNYVDGKESGLQRMWNEDGSLRSNYVVRGTRRFGLIGSKPCAGS